MSWFLSIISIVGTAVTVASFAYALYNRKEVQRVEDFFEEQSWEMYRQTYRVLHKVQAIADKPGDTDQVRILSKEGNMAGQDLLENTVTLIKRFSRQYSEGIIDEWIKIGRIFDPKHRKLFIRFIDVDVKEKSTTATGSDEGHHESQVIG